MTAGIQVFNDSNTVQIDDSVSNMRLITKGSFNTTTSNTTTVKVTGIHPLVALRITQPVGGGTNINVFQLSSVKNGNEWTFTLGYTLGGVIKPGSILEYYVFDKAPIRGSNFGFQTFAPDGSLIYDSNEKYLKVARIIQSTDFRTLGTISHPSNRKMGIIFGKLPLYESEYFQPQGSMCFKQSYTAGIRNESAGITFQETWFFSRTSLGVCTGVAPTNRSLNALMVDLTGL